ncbi:MAG TPA: alpha/beta hydrolase, partial [Bacteroidetes bacterium]|nr:alpha/beta hydrolase [Bacteroidota bacterium]
MVKKYYLFIVLFFVLQSVFAQEAFRGMPASTKLFPFGVIEEMDSKALSEKRILNIYLPQGYHPDSAATYPVIYVLDGSA